MASIKKRVSNGKTSYQVTIRRKGAPTQCGTFSSLAKANEFIYRTEIAIKEGRYLKSSKKRTVGNLIDRYIRDVLPQKPKSARRQKAQLLWWKSKIGDTPLHDVSPSMIVECRDLLSKETTIKGTIRSPSTVVRYLAALSHAFSVASKEWEWIEDSPIRKVTKPKEPRGRVRFLDEEERERLLQACKESKNPYLYIVVILALSTGMRHGEIMNLTWKDIDFEGQRITLQETKNNERRVIPLVGLAMKLLQEHAKESESDLLFPGKDPKRPVDLRFAWEKALKESGVQDFRFHDLRHTFASYLAMGKATLTELRILMGHKSPSMTARYSHLSEEHGAAVLRKMNERIFGKG